MNILNICSNIDVLTSLRTFKILVNILRISIFLFLIIYGIYKYLKKKNKKKLYRYLIVSICVLLLPTLINITLNNVNNDGYISCLKVANKKEILKLRLYEVNNLIDIAHASLNKEDYDNAVKSIKKIRNKKERKLLKESLNNLEDYFNISELIDNQNKKFNLKEYNELLDQIINVDDESIKDALYEKYYLVKRGESLNIEENTYEFNLNNIKYYVNIPNNATSNMPLFLYLNNDKKKIEYNNLYRGAKSIFGNSYPFIIVSIELNNKITTKDIIDILNNVCDKYKCNKDLINLTGNEFTWKLVSDYKDYFHMIEPVSSVYKEINLDNFKNIKIDAYSGNSNKDKFDEYTISKDMTEIINNISKINKNSKMTIINDATHSEIESLVYYDYINFYQQAFK